MNKMMRSPPEEAATCNNGPEYHRYRSAKAQLLGEEHHILSHWDARRGETGISVFSAERKKYNGWIWTWWETENIDDFRRAEALFDAGQFGRLAFEAILASCTVAAIRARRFEGEQ